MQKFHRWQIWNWNIPQLSINCRAFSITELLVLILITYKSENVVHYILNGYALLYKMGEKIQTN